MHACLEGPTSSLPSEAKARVEAYVRELLRYNERTNVYSKSAYEHLPFHVQDSVVLAQHLATQQPSGGGALTLARARARALALALAWSHYEYYRHRRHQHQHQHHHHH